jgi:glycosyltransferase involved in cell wall biosynthesis
MSTVAAIIPAYNAGRFLREALDSVLGQTRPPDEVFVIDDLSTDDTAAIARDYGTRVTLLTNEQNRGPGFSRNRGAAASGCDYLAFLDADNYWAPDHLASTVGLLDRWPTAVAAFSHAQIFGDREEVFPAAAPALDGPTPVVLELLRNNFIEHSGLIARRADFQQVGGFVSLPEKHKGRWVLADDFYLNLRLSLAGPFIGNRQVTVFYRRHAAQSSFFEAPLIAQAFRFRLRILDELKAHPRPFAPLAAAEDRTLLCWEEHLEKIARAPGGTGLATLVRFGRSHPLLAPATRVYRWRAALPAPVYGALQALRRRARS